MDLSGSLQKQNEVALRLSKMVLFQSGKSNLVFSPLSMHVLLSFLAAGAKGPTLEQMLWFLNSKSSDKLNALSAHLVDVVLADGSTKNGPQLSVANGIWVDNSLTLRPSFKEVAQNVYKASASQADFQKKADEARNEVNMWAKKETNGLIEEVLPPYSVTSMTRLILANAIYFKGVWKQKFNESITSYDEFRLLNGSSIRVPFMTSQEDQLLNVSKGFKVLGLPYKQGQDKRQFSMYFFLPDAQDGLPALVEKLGSESRFFDDHLPKILVKVGDFRIPKFKISFGLEVSKALKELGLVLPFASADFSGMVESGTNLSVSSIFQKSFIEVDEEGTEAASSTAAVMDFTSLIIPDNFVADHPFLFLIREDTSGAVLFVGQVLDPSIEG